MSKHYKLTTYRDQSGRLYGICQECGHIVRLNKPILKDLHYCVTKAKGLESRSESVRLSETKEGGA